MMKKNDDSDLNELNYQGIEQQAETLVRKLNFFRQELVKANDASQKFTLQEQIKETEQQLKEIAIKLEKLRRVSRMDISPTANEKKDKKNWLDSRSVDIRLEEFLPVPAEVLGYKVKTEAEYFQPGLSDNAWGQCFRPIEFCSWGDAKFEVHSPGFAPKLLIEYTGLSFIMADFPDDIRETLRWIRYDLMTNKDNEKMQISWVSGQYLIESTIDESSCFVRSELLEAPLDSAVGVLDKLKNIPKSPQHPPAFVMLIDFSWFGLDRISSHGSLLKEIIDRFAELHEVLIRNRQSVVLGLPRHFLLIPGLQKIMDKVGRAWVSAPLFTYETEGRAGQLAGLLRHTGTPENFANEIMAFFNGKGHSAKISVDVRDFPSISFTRCNSNALIYVIAAELSRMKEYSDWQRNLAKTLRKKGFWEPAIRLEQYLSTPTEQELEYVTVPVDILPSTEEGIYGHLDGAEEIPLTVGEGVLYSEGGGGKTTILNVLEHIYSLPRTDKMGESPAWLPLCVSEELRPLGTAIRPLLMEAGGKDIDYLLKVLSSPLYLLIDNADQLPEKLAGLKEHAQYLGSQLGVLLTHRTYPGMSNPHHSFLGIQEMALRPLTPKQASRISGRPLDKLLSAWSMIDMPRSRLCDNPFIIRHCAATLLRGQEADEDLSLTDILAESLDQRTLPRDNGRKKELFEDLLPLLAYCSLIPRKPPLIDGEELTKCLSLESLADEYDIDWLKDAAALGLMALMDEEKKAYSFRHTVFQEYFAAQYLAKKPEARQKVLITLRKRWYNCLRMMMPLLSEQERNQVFGEICNSNNTELFGIILSGLKPSQLRTLLLEVIPALVKVKTDANAIERRFIEICKAAKKEDLTAIGPADPRIFPQTLSKAKRISTFGASVAQKLEKERWGNVFQLNSVRYKLAKYPVTNLEYFQFIHEGGYDKIRGGKYWASRPNDIGNNSVNSGTRWLHSTMPERPRYWALPDEGRKALRQPNSPVVGITLHEAKAYCEWLRTRDGNHYRLPNAAEWTWAAYSRWPSMLPVFIRALPFGLPDLLPVKSIEHLHEETVSTMLQQIGQEVANKGPSPVGIVNDFESGCSDLFGNVWEWCDTFFDDNRWCVRGGPSRGCSLQSLLFDGVFTPDQRSDLVGFRLLKELNDEDE